jgi:DNA mismatch repair endonuclease MutH
MMDELATRFRPHIGRPLGEIARRIRKPLREGKGSGGVLVRAIAGLPAKGPIREFEETGIQVKTTRLNPDLMPYESMSFPAIRFNELAEEEWEDSDLQQQLAGLYIVPLIGENRGTPFAQCRLGRPFLWRPTDEQLRAIAEEWSRFRDAVAASAMKNLPTASKTEYIHMRPHGRDSSDTDELPNGTRWPKQSFWLNKDFVEDLVKRHQ